MPADALRIPGGCLRPVPISAAAACAEVAPESDNVATQSGPLAQLVARLVRIEEVRSSNLLGSTKPPRNRGFFLFSGQLPTFCPLFEPTQFSPAWPSLRPGVDDWNAGRHRNHNNGRGSTKDR